ncbi:MAG: hypothetical protein AB1546_13430 [bacterium]
MKGKTGVIFWILFLTVSVIYIHAASTGQEQKKPPQMKKWDEMTDKEKEERRKKMRGYRDDMVKIFNEKLAHRFVPEVESVSVSPTPARAGKPVQMQVKARQAKEAKDKITKVEAFYTEPGGEFFDNQVELKSGDGKLWKGTLPAFKGKGVVRYYIQVSDSAGNVYSDLPCDVKAWPPADDPCMVTVAADPEPVDDEKIQIEDDFDIWEIRIGTDKKNYYIQQNVEGKIKKGTLNPLKVNIYMGILLDTSKLSDLDDISVFWGSGEESEEARKEKSGMSAWIWYTPLAPSLHKEAPACALGVAQMGEERFDTKNIACKSDGSDLYFRIVRSRLPEGMRKTMTIVGGITGYADDPQMPIPKMRDMTQFSKFGFDRRSFRVE